MIGGFESYSPRLVGRQVTLPAGLEPAGDHVLFEDGGVDPMAFETGLNLHRAVLMVAVDASASRGNVLRMVEPHRFVEVGQAPQNEILRNVPPRGRFACGGDSDPEGNGNYDDRRFLHVSGLLRSGIPRFEAGTKTGWMIPCRPSKHTEDIGCKQKNNFHDSLGQKRG